MKQKDLAETLIGLTLYKKQEWCPEGIFKNNNIHLVKADTVVDGAIITINYENASIKVNGKRQRVPKELRTDLLEIVRLKTAKILKHAKFN